MIKRFLEQFWHFFAGLPDRVRNANALGVDFEQPPNPEEPLTRFIYSKSHFGNDRVKAPAFMPRPSDDELSVFRTHGLSNRDIYRTAPKRNQRSPRASGTLQAQQVIMLGLSINPNNVPPRHADICSWPLAREDRKELAQDLANLAILHRNPQTN